MQVEVDVELKMPDRVENSALFMLHSDLLAVSGTVLQRSHRALVMHTRSFVVSTVRHLVLLPLYLTGLKSEMETVRVHKIARHREKESAPLAAVRIMLAAKSADMPLPLVYSARVRIDVNKSAIAFKHAARCDLLLLLVHMRFRALFATGPSMYRAWTCHLSNTSATHKSMVQQLGCFAAWRDATLAMFRLNSMFHGILLLVGTTTMLVSLAVMMVTCFVSAHAVVSFGVAPSSAAGSRGSTSSSARPKATVAQLPGRRHNSDAGACLHLMLVGHVLLAQEHSG
jgi:hypothetical protein